MIFKRFVNLLVFLFLLGAGLLTFFSYSVRRQRIWNAEKFLLVTG